MYVFTHVLPDFMPTPSFFPQDIHTLILGKALTGIQAFVN